MASEVFYWKGGNTYPEKSYGDGLATGVTANQDYIWNRASNWFVKNSTGSTGSFVFTRATRFPHGGDQVKFEVLEDDPVNGLSGGPWPKTPCLYGGMGYIGNTLEWIGSQGTTAERQGKVNVMSLKSEYSCGTHGWVLGKTDYSGSFVGVDASAVQGGAEVQLRGLTVGTDVYVEFADGYGSDIASITAGDIYCASWGPVTWRDVEAANLAINTSGGAGCDYVGNANKTFITKVSDNLVISNNLTEGDYYIDNSITLDRLNIRARNYTNPFSSILIKLAETNEIWTAPRGVIVNDATGRIVIENSGNSGGDGLSIGYLEFKETGWGMTGQRIANNDTNITDWYTNNTLEFACGITVSNLVMNSGKLEFTDISNAEVTAIKDGTVSNNSVIDMRLANFNVSQRLGTAGSGSDYEGLQVQSTDVIYVFTPGTLVNSVSGSTAGDTYVLQAEIPNTPKPGGGGTPPPF